MFTRDELDTIIAACDAADKLDRMLCILGLNTSKSVKAHLLLLSEKAQKAAEEMDKAEEAKKKAELESKKEA